MAAESIVDVVHLLRLLPLHELEGQLLVVDVGGAVAAPVPAAAAELTARLTAQLRGGALDVDVMLHQLCLLRNIFLVSLNPFLLLNSFYPNVLFDLVILYMSIHKLHQTIMSSFYTILVFSSRPFCLSHLSNLFANIMICNIRSRLMISINQI